MGVTELKSGDVLPGGVNDVSICAVTGSKKVTPFLVFVTVVAF